MNEYLFYDATESELDTDGDTNETAGSETDSDEPPNLDAPATAAAMGIGTGIANTLDNTASWETGWGAPEITQKFIEGIAQNGLKTVRLPVAWNAYAVDGVIQEDKMARVREVVEWIIAADLYCIVDIHWDDGWISGEKAESIYQLSDEARTLYQSYWQQIAGAFSDVGNRLLFESMNDESFYVDGDSAGTPDYAPLNDLNQLFVTTVRAAEGFNETRNLLIAGFNAKIEKTCVDDFEVPADPAGKEKLLLSVHYYTPHAFTIMNDPGIWEDEWTEPVTTWGTEEELIELQSIFDIAAAFSAERGLPVVVSEFTVISGSGSYTREAASRQLWLKSVMETALSLNMVPILYDWGTDINRTDGSFSTEFSEAISGLTK